MQNPRSRRPAAPARPEIVFQGKPIADWPRWVAQQRAAGWPPRARDALKLALLPIGRLNPYAALEAIARGEP